MQNNTYQPLFLVCHGYLIYLEKVQYSATLGQIYRLCLKKIVQCSFFFFFFTAEKVNKAQQQHSGGQKHNFPVCEKIFKCIIPWSGVKVMVL